MKSLTFHLMLCFFEQLYSPPVFSFTTPLLSCYFFLLQVIALSFQLLPLLSTPIFQASAFFLPLGLSLRRKAQTLLYFIPNQNKVNNPQCLRMGSPKFSVRGKAFSFFPSSKIPRQRPHGNEICRALPLTFTVLFPKAWSAILGCA